jgi:hypothetical protein
MDKYALQYEVGRALRWLAHLSLAMIEEVYEDQDLTDHGMMAVPRRYAVVRAEEGVTCIELTMLKEMIQDLGLAGYRAENDRTVDLLNGRVCLCGECFPV